MTTKRSNVDKFTDKERDWESGLDDFGARYLDSSPGRFMAPTAIALSKRAFSLQRKFTRNLD